MKRKLFHSLAVKMFVLFSGAGLTAMMAVFFISYRQLYSSAVENEKYLAQQRFDQTGAILEEFMNRVVSTTRLAAGSEQLNEQLKRLSESRSFEEQYTQVTAVTEWVRSVCYGLDYDSFLFYLNGRFPLSDSLSEYVRSADSEKGRQIESEFTQNGGRPFWLTVTDGPGGGTSLAFVRQIRDMEDFSRVLGIMVLYIDGRRLADDFLAAPQELYYISKEDQKNIIEAPHDGEKMPGGKGEVSWYREKEQIGETGYWLFAAMPLPSGEKPDGKKGGWPLHFFLFVSLLLLLAVWLISRSVSARIRRLSKTVERVPEGRLETMDEDPCQDEIGQLVGNYNYMIRYIRRLLDEQYRLGLEKKGAELKALQSQINPHFLYNTLDMINWMASKNEMENIRKTVFSLARYYRLILSKGRDIITIGSELELCEAYIAIQQKRYRGKILFELSVDESLRQYLIPKITLQPLIENAIVHGIMEKSSGRGTVIISGWEEEGEIILSVTDDGIGMPAEQAIQKNGGGSRYGITNIEKRLTLFYNMKKCITCESTRGIGTCVSIRIKKEEGAADEAFDSGR